MRTRNVLIAVVGTLALLMAASTGSIASYDYVLDISPIPEYWEGGDIPHHVTEPPEQIWVHLSGPTELHVIEAMSEHFDPPRWGHVV